MSNEPQHDAVIIGAGVCGIYMLHRLREQGLNVTVLEGSSDLGGTWFNNRYPGCRFDSESYTYGYSFDQELLEDWHWKERFSPQPENLRYLNHVADKFDLRPDMQFDCRLEYAHFDDDNHLWKLGISDGREITTRFLLTALGLLSAPTMPLIEGVEDFEGPSFHTYDWPHEPLDVSDKRVAVVGTGATGVQVIGALAGSVGSLTVFQRRPNWAAPLHNSEISDAEMDDIRRRYDDIFATCARTPGGFEHEPDRRGFFNVSPDERRAMWEKLYDEPGFGIWMANFREIWTDEEANAELSEFIAEKIRSRVDDPAIAEKLIPKDHGFGVQRVPLETRYYEAYNHPTTTLVDLQETPIERITSRGIQTTDQEREFDVIVYATGFDAITGSFDRIDIRGAGGVKLRDKWSNGPVTYLGMQVNGFPNMITVAGPQSGSASTNYPRGIEIAVDWTAELMQYLFDNGHTRMEATAEAEEEWTQHVADMYSVMLMRKAQGWFTGYNSNVPGHEHGTVRHLVYNGGAPKFRNRIDEVAQNDYQGMRFEGGVTVGS